MWKLYLVTGGLLVVILGCGLKRPLTNWLIVDGTYRVVAEMCTEPKEILGETGVVLGLGFDVTEIEGSCPESALQAFVSVGLTSQLEKARQLTAHQQVVLTGTLEGKDRRTLMVQQIKIRN